MSDWVNDAEWYCAMCDTTFKVYKKGDEPNVNFCPSCANSDLEAVEPEE